MALQLMMRILLAAMDVFRLDLATCLSKVFSNVFQLL